MTGAGILDCKKYLIKANNDIDKAIKLFRSEAGVKADKKGSRIAAEGIVNYYQNHDSILLFALTKYFLQSSMPAPVISLSCLTSCFESFITIIT